jgi:hypothetical protein
MQNLHLCVQKSLAKKENFTIVPPAGTYSGGSFNPLPDYSLTSGGIDEKQHPFKRRQYIENYKKEPNIMTKRILQYLDNNVISLIDPKLGILSSIINKKFSVNKITISFGSDKDIDWTPIQQLENIRDSNGNLILVDPIEYEIRKLSPINAVKKILRDRIAPMVNIRFEFVDEKEGFNLLDEGVVRISFDRNGGSWSLVGLDNFFSADEFTMNLGWLDSGTIMHEFGHMLGMIHEHQGPLGKPIEWDTNKVYKWAKVTYGWDKETTYENVIKKYDSKLVNGTNFDPNSIMLYFFPSELTLDGRGTHQNLRLSILDVAFLMASFPFEKKDKYDDYKLIYRDFYGTSSSSSKRKNFYVIILLITLILIFATVYLVKFRMNKYLKNNLQ